MYAPHIKVRTLSHTPEQVLFTEHHLRKEAIQHQDEKSDQPNISGKPKPV